MSGPKQFGEPTHWEIRPDSITEGWTQGWVVPHANFYIGKADQYWGRVLDEARQAYGDSNIHYNTSNTDQDRYLVFGDGTRLPADGTVVYHDPSTRQNFLQNTDGTVCPIGGDGRAGAPITPVAYRKAADGSYAPLDGHGQQIAPLQAGIPFGDNGLHTDPATGLLTPKNADGDYYTVGPDGTKSYFDRNGAPISADRFANTPGAPGVDPAPAAVLSTDEQQSGRAADAVKKLQGELKNRYSIISDAEEKLSEVLLNAHATTADGQQRLNDIQHKIIDAVNNPSLSLDTPAGEEAFLRFLRGQVKDIGEVVNSGDLTAEDQAQAARALGQLYGEDAAGEHAAGHDEAGGPPAAEVPAAPATPAAAPAPLPAVSADPVLTDPGVGPADPMPAPLADVLGGEPLDGLGADGVPEFASMLPGVLGGLGGGPLDGLSGLAGAAAPLAGLAPPLGGDRPDKHDSDADDKSEDDSHRDKDEAVGDDQRPQPDNGQRPGDLQPGTQPDATPGAGAAPAGPAPVPAPTTLVSLPDGSSATARTPALAQAVKAHLAGRPVEVAYRAAGIELPPPGTPVTNPVDPSSLSCGTIGEFKDHYVVALSAVKAYQDGQVVPLAAVASSPDFLGWVDPTALGAAGTVPAPPASPEPAPVGAG
ncbi:MAG: DUF4226 domain-containing protein [Mycobacterium sp.]|nr:DUF4226 domain-containing protein [Mycobacterium sp.]